jgi:hypothetical protein
MLRRLLNAVGQRLQRAVDALREGKDPTAIMPGHRRRYEAGPCHPLPVEMGGMPPPGWVTDQGCDMVLLAAAHASRLVFDQRGDDWTVNWKRARRIRSRQRVVSGELVRMPKLIASGDER